MKKLYYLLLFFAIPTIATLAQQTISGNTGTNNVTLSWFDGTTQSTTSDGFGDYSIVVPTGWSGDVTPSKVGYSFSLEKNTYTNVIIDQINQDFSETINTYTISGNTNIGPVDIAWTGGAGTTSDGSGNYSFTVEHGWTGGIAPTKTGYTFSPVNISLTNVTENKINQNFTETIDTYTISGNTNIGAVDIAWTGGVGTTSDGSGNYSFTVDHDWSGDITPSKTGYTFSPANISLANVTENKINQDFTGTIDIYTISGNTNIGVVDIAWTGGVGTTSDGIGNYSFTVDHGWTGDITPSKTGYTFSPVNISHTNVTENKINQDFTDIVDNHELTTLVSPLESGSITGGGSLPYGTLAVLTAIPENGYTFVNWTGDTLSIDNPINILIDKDKSVTANFTLNNYVITTSSEPVLGGITNGGGAFDHGDSVKVVATPVDGYDFVNWTENDLEVSIDSIYTFLADTSRNLIANFSLTKYEVFVNISPIESGTITGVGLYEHFSPVELVATPTLGWKFDNWKEDLIIVDNDSIHTFIIISEKIFTATFSKIIYSISTSSDPSDGGITSGTGNYSHDSLVTIVATPNEGWNFLGWFENDEPAYEDSLEEFSANENRTLVAKFEKKTYEIFTIRNPAIGGMTQGDSIYTHGDQVSLTAIPDSANGYEFVNWTEDNILVSTSIVYNFIASKATNIQANFQLRSYNLELLTNVENAGTITGDGTFTHGDSVSVSANPSAGWNFANWTNSNNLSLSDMQTFKIMILSDSILTANFAHELYNIGASSNPIDGGFVSGTGTVFFGQTITLSATPNMGWKFKNWTENGNIVSSDSAYIFTVDGSRNLVAIFSLENYSINCSVSPVEAGLTSGCGLAFYDDQMNLLAEANNDWKFINWTENGDTVSTFASYIFNVKGNRDLVANFETLTGIEKVDNSENIPDTYFLSNAYPNPFNPSTKIEFGLPHSAEVTVNIFNIAGQLVGNIINNTSLPAGIYRNSFDGSKLSSGIYFYHISAQSLESDNEFSQVKKLILVK